MLIFHIQALSPGLTYQSGEPARVDRTPPQLPIICPLLLQDLRDVGEVG